MSKLLLDAKIFVAGHRGLVGASLVRHLEKKGFTKILVRSRGEVDLTNRKEVFAFFKKERPEYVFLAAAKVGGIAANIASPVAFFLQNIEIQNNVLMACHDSKVKKTLFLGSSCIYPRESPQPMKEEHFMHGPVEPTNASYAIAKIAGIQLAQSLVQQYGMDVICPMPCNVYGPGDHFEFERSHVVSALVRRFVEAKRKKAPSVTLWGTGSAYRELLHVDDLADACLFLMENYSSADIINVGSGEDVRIKALAQTISDTVGFCGTLEWDTTKPDGMPRKLMDVSRITALGWRYKIDLVSGIRSVVADFEERYPE